MRRLFAARLLARCFRAERLARRRLQRSHFPPDDDDDDDDDDDESSFQKQDLDSDGSKRSRSRVTAKQAAGALGNGGEVARIRLRRLQVRASFGGSR